MRSMLPAHTAIAASRLSHCNFPKMPADEVVHDHSGIAVYLSGTTRLWMGMDYTLRRGDVLLIPEGMPHCSSGESDGEMLGAMLCTGCMRPPWAEPLKAAFNEVRRGQPAIRHLSDEALAQLEIVFSHLIAELAQDPQPLMIDGLMSQITALILRATPLSVTQTASSPPVIAAALSFIERRATDQISLSDVAQHVGRAPAHLAALMKRHTDRTVVEWITHGRMAVARQLLRGSEEAIESVAERAGFASPSHFHRTFKRLHQATPSQWRKLHR